jgi:hypothetical protein
MSTSSPERDSLTARDGKACLARRSRTIFGTGPRDYMYVKMKVLIVNGMIDKIVDMFPETQPLC